jgi:hypothetical protein
VRWGVVARYIHKLDVGPREICFSDRRKFFAAQVEIAGEIAPQASTAENLTPVAAPLRAMDSDFLQQILAFSTFH